MLEAETPPTFVVTIGTGDLPAAKALEYVKEQMDKIQERALPHERWFFVSDRGHGTKIERIS